MRTETYNYTQSSSNRWNDVNLPNGPQPFFFNGLPPIPRTSASVIDPPLQDPRRGDYDSWLTHDDSMMPRPFAITSTRRRRTTPHSLVHIFVLNNDLPRTTHPRSRVLLPLPYNTNSPPRFSSHINEQVPREDYNASKLTAEQQKEALSKLRKQTYNPVPKNPNHKPNYELRDWTIIFNKGEIHHKEKENHEGGKGCAVCLEDFEPREAVTLTPCSHMFHEDCIVPWVKSQGRCPVCRFVFSERFDGGRSSSAASQ